MDFSDEQKLIVLMLADLYNTTGKSGGVDYELDPNFIKEAIFTNNTWAIPWRFPGIEFNNDETPEYIKELFNILDMWSMIESKMEQLSEEVVQNILKKNELEPYEASFIGFNSRTEAEYINATRFIIIELDRFTEFKERYLFAHWDTLPKYKRMLKVFDKIFNSDLVTYNEGLSTQNLIDLLKA